jgi:hypothetical protein
MTITVPRARIRPRPRSLLQSHPEPTSCPAGCWARAFITRSRRGLASDLRQGCPPTRVGPRLAIHPCHPAAILRTPPFSAVRRRVDNSMTCPDGSPKSGRIRRKHATWKSAVRVGSPPLVVRIATFSRVSGQIFCLVAPAGLVPYSNPGAGLVGTRWRPVCRRSWSRSRGSQAFSSAPVHGVTSRTCSTVCLVGWSPLARKAPLDPCREECRQASASGAPKPSGMATQSWS